MSFCMILYVVWKLNGSIRKIVFRHKNNGLRMCRRNPVAIDCFVSLGWCILEKLEKGHSSHFHELFLMD